MTSDTKMCAAGVDNCGQEATHALYVGRTLADALADMERVSGGGIDLAFWLCYEHIGVMLSRGDRVGVVLPL